MARGSFEKLTGGDAERVCQLDEGRQPEVFFASFDGPSKRARKAALVRQVFLRPVPLLTQRPDSEAQSLPDLHNILHSPTVVGAYSGSLRSVIGRSIIGYNSRHPNWNLLAGRSTMSIMPEGGWGEVSFHENAPVPQSAPNSSLLRTSYPSSSGRSFPTKLLIVLIGLLVAVFLWHVYLSMSLSTSRLSVNPLSDVVSVQLPGPETTGSTDPIEHAIVQGGLSLVAAPIAENKLNLYARQHFDLYAWLVPYRVAFDSKPVESTFSPTRLTNESTPPVTESMPQDLSPVEITTQQMLLAFHNDFYGAQKQFPEGRRLTITGPVVESHYPSAEAVQEAEIQMGEGRYSPWNGPPLPDAQIWLGPAGVAPPGFPPIIPANEMDSVDRRSLPGVTAVARQGFDKDSGTPTWFGQPLPVLQEPMGEQLTLTCRMYSADHLPPKKFVAVLGQVMQVPRLVDVSIAVDDCVLVKRGSDEPANAATENPSEAPVNQ